MQFNGVNNKEHQRSLVDSGLLHMRLRGNSTFSSLRRSCLCFERNLQRCEVWQLFVQAVFPTLSSLFPLFIHCNGCLFPFPVWGPMTGLPGFASHGRSLHPEAGCQ